MARVDGLTDRQYLAKQYRDAGNLNARINIHRRFSANPQGLLRWIFERFTLPPACRILELGGGPGNLWVENLDRLPQGWAVTLSDVSIGMVRQARENLNGCAQQFRFGIANAQSIPFASRTFDAVIADHMLYHVPDRRRALSEMRRVLIPGGRLFASTIGDGHMRELADLAARFDADLGTWGSCGFATGTFTLENGASQISAFFGNVSVDRYEDSLAVTEVAPLVDYMLSGRIQLDGARRNELTEFIAREMERAGGILRITKETGIFEAVRV